MQRAAFDGKGSVFSVTVRLAVPAVPILISIGVPPLLMDLL